MSRGIFISYRRDDASIAARLYNRFLDVLKLRPGDIWNPKIFRAIDESDLFVVISKNASDSEWVKKESRYALS